MPGTFDDLWTRYLEGELDEQGMAELSRLLEEDPELLRHATDLYEDHRLLGFLCRETGDAGFVRDTIGRATEDADRFVETFRARTPHPQRARKHHLPWLVQLVTVSVVVLVAFLVGRYTPVESLPDDVSERESSNAAVETPTPTYVATLAGCEGCRWNGSRTYSSGQRLLQGALRLESGTALLRFDGGAMVVLRGPSAIELESPGGAILLSGSATVRSADEAAGFVLRTAKIDVVDIGTEFHVAVDDSGATEVHVLEGGVEWQKADVDEPSGVRVLTSGQALRFDSTDDFAGRPVAMSAQRFVDVAPNVGTIEAAGRLLAYEGFDDPEETSEASNPSYHAGRGWAGPWGRAHHDRSLPSVASFWRPESLLGPQGFASSSGGRVDFPAGEDQEALFAAYTRALETPVALAEDGVYYFSFLLHRSDVTTPEEKAHYQWFRAMLTSPGDIKSRIGVGMSSRGEPMIYGPTGNVVARRILPANQTYLFVAKIVCGRDRPDQVFLEVYAPEDEVSPSEPIEWTATGRAVDLDCELSMLHLYNGLSREYSLDEIRLATSWQAAMGL